MAIGTPVTLGTGSATTSATTIALTTSAAVAAGETVVIAACNVDGTATNPTCSGGGLTWTLDKVIFDSTTGGTLALFSAPAPAGLAISTVITVTFAAAETRRLIAGMKISGLRASAPADVSASNSAASGSAWSTGTTATRTVATEITIGAATGRSGATPAATSTATAPATELHDVGVGTATPWTSLTTAYHQESATGTSSVAGTWSKSESVGWDGIVVAYKGLIPASLLPYPPSRQRHPLLRR